MYFIAVSSARESRFSETVVSDGVGQYNTCVGGSKATESVAAAAVTPKSSSWLALRTSSVTTGTAW